MTPAVVRDSAALSALVSELQHVRRFAIDLESDGMYTYRAKLCVIQIATDAGIWIVDSLAVDPSPLAPLLLAAGPIKIIHDVAFDARLLAEAGILLGNVHDTALAAQWLKRPATGLGSLLLGELGITVDKSMQHHDWSRRPLDARAITYLTGDVAHLGALHDRLWSEVVEKGIEGEVLLETDYRIATATEGARSTPPSPYLRMKGIDRVPPKSRPIVRRLGVIREAAAAAANVPPYKIVTNDVIFAIAAAAPESEASLAKIKGVDRFRRHAREVLEAISLGQHESLPPDEAATFERPRVNREELDAKRRRENSLTAWRKAEAAQRGVDEQAVLPGHCLREFAARDNWTLESMAAVGGFGTARQQRYGAAILDALSRPAPPPAAARASDEVPQ